MPAMSPQQRAEFLDGVHVAILTIDEPGRGPFAAPVWYEHNDGVLEVQTGGDTLKARLARAAGRATLTVQQEAWPYKYVAAEGPVEVLEEVRDVEPIAVRYLGPEGGAGFAASNPNGPGSVVLRITPEHFRSGDFSQG